MGYPSRHYPDSMANLYYNNNFYNDTVRERDVVSRSDYQRYIKRSEAPWRTEFQELKQTAQMMQQEVRQLWESFERRQMRAHWNHKDTQEYRMNIDLPSFDGYLHIEDYLDWIMEVERFFAYMCIPEEKKVKLVAYKLKGGASAWWEWLKLSRSREGKRPVTSWPKMKRLLNARFLPLDDYGILREPVRYPYVDRFREDDVSHFRHVHNHLHNSPNRPFAYEENFNYGEEVVEDVKLVEEVELPLEKTYVQPPSLIPTTTSMEEQLPPPPPQVQLPLPQLQPPPPQVQPSPPQMQPSPPQVQLPLPQMQPTPHVQLITIITKIDDSFEENNEVEDDTQEEIVGGILVEVDEKEKSCLDSIYIDFSKYFSSEEPHVPCPKENSRTSFFSSGGV
ncbi:uncharacterized protein LOC132189308 [Corylus avellana]|uniref:uncharacterized protein LOC132189308 n=1 Tax=Corylus avellana TaxID=13451 RepID=UPI00286A6A1B|nr:uncharacterized protein LOC132189308 [Corylus avellana]XP_059459968.1 uncharacterized protein LOC132189308 [Corylus avellana]XP_059459970.1 uncharacterized protein LOC132189308 [Corylus avellana]XP_059459971.1 uncharacterized protein LOC132189308 [Corylus avellana]XP_059459972.1 uncharacterized protein LOC132189308 [Corylus avellana]